VRELKADGSLPANTKRRSSKYLNSLIEQDYRGVKQRIAVMLERDPVRLKHIRHWRGNWRIPVG
jgi:transposase-like protein